MDSLLVAGLSLLTTIIGLIQKAMTSDPAAQQKLRRVEEVLTDSPTERVWADALERAKAKPEVAPPPPNPFDGSDDGA